MADFELDERLENDTELVAILGLCQLRLRTDSRWPWLILVPMRNDVEEVFELTPLDQTLLTFETNLIGETLLKITGADKINIAAIGNIVRQLHIHVIARFEGDANWPNPVWGFGTPEAYDEKQKSDFILKLQETLSA